MVAAVCAGGIGFGLWENSWLQVTRYSMESDRISREMTIVHLTDLHNREFGRENEELVKLIRQEKPDLIVITGDCLNASEERTDVMCTLLEKCVELAPVYVSLGNHEVAYMENSEDDDVANLLQEMYNTGVQVLDREFMDVEIEGNSLRIGGIYGYILSEETAKDTFMENDRSEIEFMTAFGDTDRFRVLLSHRPEGLLLWNSMEVFEVDLIFSGHLHGGQVRLPFIGGLYTPEEGWFPSVTDGYFEKEGSIMILSRGLGSMEDIPRWNNRPQIISLKVEPAKSN